MPLSEEEIWTQACTAGRWGYTRGGGEEAVYTPRTGVQSHLPSGPQKEPALPTPRSQASSLQSREKMNVCCSRCLVRGTWLRRPSPMHTLSPHIPVPMIAAELQPRWGCPPHGHLHPSLWAFLRGPVHLPFTYPGGRGAAALGPDPDGRYFCK